MRLHQRLHDAALQQRREGWSRQCLSLEFSAQCRELTALRREDETHLALNALERAQVTHKRLDLAFLAFFRRAFVPALHCARALQRLGVQDAWRAGDLCPAKALHGRLRGRLMRGKPQEVTLAIGDLLVQGSDALTGLGPGARDPLVASQLSLARTELAHRLARFGGEGGKDFDTPAVLLGALDGDRGVRAPSAGRSRRSSTRLPGKPPPW